MRAVMGNVAMVFMEGVGDVRDDDGGSGLLLLLADDLGDGLAFLLEALPAFEIVLAHLLEVLLKENLPLLAVLGLLALPKDLEDVFL